MRKVLKIELYRAFSNKFFFLSVGIGCILAFLEYISQLGQVQELIALFFTYQKPMTGIDWYFSSWIGGHTTLLFGYIFYLLFPILAVLPHGDSYYTDWKSGFLKNIALRVKRRDYFLAKYISVFISAGAAVTIPLLFSLVLTGFMLPGILPQVSSGSHSVFSYSMWHSLFYTHPFIYTFLYIGVDFIFAGLFAAIALAVSISAQNRLITLLSPFVFYVGINAVCDFTNKVLYTPEVFLIPGSGAGRGPIIIAEGLLLFLITFAAFVIRGCRNDVY